MKIVVIIQDDDDKVIAVGQITEDEFELLKSKHTTGEYVEGPCFHFSSN